MIYTATLKRQKTREKMCIMERGVLFFYDIHQKVPQVAAYTSSPIHLYL